MYIAIQIISSSDTVFSLVSEMLQGLPLGVNPQSCRSCVCLAACRAYGSKGEWCVPVAYPIFNIITSIVVGK